MSEKNLTINEYFASNSGYIHTVSFRYLLTDLDMNLKYFSKQLGELLTVIT